MPILAGEPVVEGKVATEDGGRGLAALVPTGMRAYTIQARTVGTNVAGFILPGNKVDILLTLQACPNDESGGGSTTTLLQAVEILAVGQQLDPPAENLNDPRQIQSATLLVTPDQAAMLDLGQSVGQLSLALRNPEDIGEAMTLPALLSDIRYRQEKPVAEAEQAVFVEAVEEASPREIVTMRGRHRGTVWVTPVER